MPGYMIELAQCFPVYCLQYDLLMIICILVNFSIWCFHLVFRALMLLVGRQEGIWSVKTEW